MANRVLLGNRATGGYGLYVSKSGSNVLDATNANLLFSSVITDSNSDVTSKNGQTFMLIQQGCSVCPGDDDAASINRNFYFPAIRNNDDDYSSPFCLASWEHDGSGANSEPHVGVYYDSSDESYPIWGGILEVHAEGYAIDGSNYSSGTMYGRVFTQCPVDATFKYAVFHMAMER